MGGSYTRGRIGVPDFGVGVGLRIPHYRHVLDVRPAMGFFEIISENFMIDGGKPLYHLDRVLESYRVIQHGVSLNIGGPEPLDRDYLTRLKALTRRVKPAWLSDHFCWCGAGGAHLHDLLPLPYTEEMVERVAERARVIQDYLEVPFALENTSSYLRYTASTMTEWEFVSEVVERADCGLMFDVNNVYVSSYNHDFDPLEFVRSVPHDRIVQIHLAGHTHLGRYIIDTHRGHVPAPVLELYRETIRLAGPVSTLIEWDDDIPEFPVLAAEADKVRALRDEALSPNAEPPSVVDLDWVDTSRIPASGAPTPRLVPQAWSQGGPRTSASQELVTSETQGGSTVE
jgi:uncharacterized protein (UPF0276 family)